MKIQIRQSVFETNSSSEHSISIVKKSNFEQWKRGEQYARRVPGHKSYEETWGNFWSDQYFWDFNRFTKEEADERNKEIFLENLKNAIESTKNYLRLQQDDISSRKWAEDHLKDLEGKTFDKVREIDKLYDHMWITYNEYIKALSHDDCYSPFEHVNDTEDVVVFGKYFHS